MLVSWTCWAVGTLGPNETRLDARREGTSIHLSESIVVAAGITLLAAVGLTLFRTGHATGGTRSSFIALGIASVALSWPLVHTVFAMRYARAFDAVPFGGIDFNEDDSPTYLDFAYLALTNGMKFQVSDTNLTQDNEADRSHTCSALLLVRSGDRGPRHQYGVQSPPLIDWAQW